MEEKQKKLKAKVINKHETEADWLLSQYVPDIGEVVFYDPDERYSYTRQKNGDGIHKVSELPFATEAQQQADWTQTDETKTDFIKNKPENLVYSEDSELGDATLPEGGNGGGIIDVTELPTENIDENSIYRMRKNAYTYFPLTGEINAIDGNPVELITVDTLPEVGIDYLRSEDGIVMIFTGYHRLSDNSIWLYLPADLNGGNAQWVNGELSEPPIHIVPYESEAVDTGMVYVIYNSNYTYHIYKDGIWTELVSKDYVDTRACAKSRAFQSLDLMFNWIYEHPEISLPVVVSSGAGTLTNDETSYMLALNGRVTVVRDDSQTTMMIDQLSGFNMCSIVCVYQDGSLAGEIGCFYRDSSKSKEYYFNANYPDYGKITLYYY